jgi:hypothetical protein
MTCKTVVIQRKKFQKHHQKRTKRKSGTEIKVYDDSVPENYGKTSRRNNGDGRGDDPDDPNLNTEDEK